MSARSDRAPTTRAIVDTATNTLTFTREFAAPCEKVFSAWTDPGQVRQWWDPSGVPLKHCRIDLRPGGSFEFANADSAGPAFQGVYREVSPPHRLVFDALGAVGQVQLEPKAGDTRLTVTIKCASAEHLKHFVEMGVEIGTAQTLDNLVDFVQLHTVAS